jgi:serine protease Do
MMKKAAYMLLACVWPGWLAAQHDVPLLLPEEQQVVDGQAEEINQALTPILATAAKSTVRVWAGKRRLAYGTVIADGHKVLTKLSEIRRAPAGLRVEAGDGAVRTAVVTGVYQDEDIALLTLEGEPLTPVTWCSDGPRLGSFLTAPQPGGQAAGFGVVSVLERNLRETDKAYLGVLGDPRFEGPGVKLREVTPDSGAAAAGLMAGDVILRVDDRPISGMLELRNALAGRAPGTRVPVTVSRSEKQIAVEILLGNRPDLPRFSGERLRQMEQMGGPTSRVRDAFSNVIQTDMRPKPEQIGGPVVDLQGRVVGITLARADRTRSFVMSSAAVAKMLERQPLDPATVQVTPPGQRAAGRAERRAERDGMPPGIVPIDPERRRRHIEDMQRLMDRMREELDRLDEMNR